MSASITTIDATRRQIAEARDFDDVKDIRAKAKAMQAYAKEALDRKRLDHATEIQILAEIKMGEMLLSLGERRGGKQTSHERSLPSNKELGLTDKQSSLWKQLAALSPEERKTAIEEAKNRVADAIEKRRRQKDDSETKEKASPLEAAWAKASEGTRQAFMTADERLPYISAGDEHEVQALNAMLWHEATTEERKQFIADVTPAELVEAFGARAFYLAMSEDQKEEINDVLIEMWEAEKAAERTEAERKAQLKQLNEELRRSA